MDTKKLSALIKFRLILWKNPEGQEFDAGFDGRDYRCRTATAWKTRRIANKRGLIEATRIRIEQARAAGDVKEHAQFSKWLKKLLPNAN